MSPKIRTRLKALALFNTEGRNPDNFLEILLVLANRGPMIKNEVAKSLGKREGDISKRVDWLLEVGFIEEGKPRVLKSRFRTIKLKRYRPTLKGIFAISHEQVFDPIRIMEFYEEIPPVLLELIASFGSEKVKGYVNKVANKVKESIDETPVFEEIGILDEAMWGPLLRFGVEELPTLLGGSKLDLDTKQRIQKVLLRYSGSIVSWLDNQSNQMLEQAKSLQTLKAVLVKSENDPSKLEELFESK